MTLQRSTRTIGFVAVLASVSLACACAPSPRSTSNKGAPVEKSSVPRRQPRNETTAPSPVPPSPVGSNGASHPTTPKPTAPKPVPTPPATTTTTTARPSSDGPAGVVSGGYEVTVYYTAVESFHTDGAVAVIGCLVRDCARGSERLGSYPASFVNAVRGEGTGRITSGVHAGRYLNWSYDVGYWLDDVAVDSFGGSLVPFSSSAGDGDCGSMRMCAAS